MDVSSWGLGKIMELPDRCFGRRWPIAVVKVVEAAAPGYVISDAGLPEVGVVWAMWVSASGATWSPSNAVFRLGDALPATLAEFNLLEALFGSLEGVDPIKSVLYTGPMGVSVVVPMRYPVTFGGRRLVCEMTNLGTAAVSVQAGIVVSSVPKSVGEWFISG